MSRRKKNGRKEKKRDDREKVDGGFNPLLVCFCWTGLRREDKRKIKEKMMTSWWTQEVNLVPSIQLNPPYPYVCLSSYTHINHCGWS